MVTASNSEAGCWQLAAVLSTWLNNIECCLLNSLSTTVLFQDTSVFFIKSLTFFGTNKTSRENSWDLCYLKIPLSDQFPVMVYSNYLLLLLQHHFPDLVFNGPCSSLQKPGSRVGRGVGASGVQGAKKLLSWQGSEALQNGQGHWFFTSLYFNLGWYRDSSQVSSGHIHHLIQTKQVNVVYIQTWTWFWIFLKQL